MMKDFSGGRIQYTTTLRASEDSEIYHQPASNTEIKEDHGASRWFYWLKKVSFGKYRTPMYY